MGRRTEKSRQMFYRMGSRAVLADILHNEKKRRQESADIRQNEKERRLESADILLNES
jgi:hypothetical protein